MDLGDFETTIKVIVVGNGGVGKSSMASRYCKGVYTTTYKKTIGVDFLEKSIDLEHGESVKLMIWDTAGQEEFDALTSSYYRGTGACALVFSTVDRASFESIEKWKKKIEAECGNVVMALVQNKVDLIAEAVVTPAEVEALARKLKMKLFRTCVKENVNVAAVFEHLAAQYILTSGGGGGATTAVAAVGDMGSHGGTRDVGANSRLSPGGAGEAASATASAGDSGQQAASAAGTKSAARGGDKGGAGARSALPSSRTPATPTKEIVYDPGDAHAASEAPPLATPPTIRLGKNGRRERPKSKTGWSFC